MFWWYARRGKPVAAAVSWARRCAAAGAAATPSERADARHASMLRESSRVVCARARRPDAWGWCCPAASLGAEECARCTPPSSRADSEVTSTPPFRCCCCGARVAPRPPAPRTAAPATTRAGAAPPRSNVPPRQQGGAAGAAAPGRPRARRVRPVGLPPRVGRAGGGVWRGGAGASPSLPAGGARGRGSRPARAHQQQQPHPPAARRAHPPATARPPRAPPLPARSAWPMRSSPRGPPRRRSCART